MSIRLPSFSKRRCVQYLTSIARPRETMGFPMDMYAFTSCVFVRATWLLTLMSQDICVSGSHILTMGTAFACTHTTRSRFPAGN